MFNNGVLLSFLWWWNKLDECILMDVHPVWFSVQLPHSLYVSPKPSHISEVVLSWPALQWSENHRISQATCQYCKFGKLPWWIIDGIRKIYEEKSPTESFVISSILRCLKNIWKLSHGTFMFWNHMLTFFTSEKWFSMELSSWVCNYHYRAKRWCSSCMNFLWNT